ncbi:MAG: hypothetical protein ACOZQL_17565 [Myxococcota bacterium]
MRWVLFVVLMLVAGCQRPCNASTCGSGCCAEGGECVDGNTRFECGTGGAACVRCSSKERCADARCEALPVSDAGVDAGPPGCTCATSCCLPDGSCAPNNEPSACGPARQFCGTCAAGLRCEFGVCVSATCAGCFDGLGVCRPGSSATACGGDGGLCAACLTDQACMGGACVYTRCDSSNCRFGCCQPDLRCETSIGAAACGLNGDPCATCSAGQQCLGGGCQ